MDGRHGVLDWMGLAAPDRWVGRSVVLLVIWSSISGSYAQNFSPARALLPHLRTPADVDSSWPITKSLDLSRKSYPYVADF